MARWSRGDGSRHEYFRDDGALYDDISQGVAKIEVDGQAGSDARFFRFVVHDVIRGRFVDGSMGDHYGGVAVCRLLAVILLKERLFYLAAPGLQGGCAGIFPRARAGFRRQSSPPPSVIKLRNCCDHSPGRALGGSLSGLGFVAIGCVARDGQIASQGFGG